MNINLLFITTENLAIIYKTNAKRLKGGEKKAYQPGTSGAKERYSGESPGFLFISYIPKSSNLEAHRLFLKALTKV